MLNYKFEKIDTISVFGLKGQDCVEKCKITLAAREKDLARLKSSKKAANTTDKDERIKKLEEVIENLRQTIKRSEMFRNSARYQPSYLR